MWHVTFTASEYWIWGTEYAFYSKYRIKQYAWFESFPFRQKFFLFSSTRPRDFDRMLGTGFPVSMYTTKTSIDMWRFNVPQLKNFLTFSVKDRYQLNIFFVSKTSMHRQLLL